jgi:carboxypeptidase Taq
MLTPAEELGLSGATLDARVRRAVNHVSDRELAYVERRLAEDARLNELVYERDGVMEPVRVMLRPLLIMPEQLAYVHRVCSTVIDALKRLPDLYLGDPDVRRVLTLTPEEHEWLEECWRAPGRSSNPLYARLDAVCDFTSARWQDSLQFLEPNLSGVGGIHLGPLAETLVMRDVVPTLKQHDPTLAVELPRDQRDLFLQVLLDHARTLPGPTSNICLVEPKYVAEGPREQSHLVAYFQAQRGITLLHADPRELRLEGEDVYYEDARVDVAYRDYEIRDLLDLERSEGRKLDAIRTLFRQNRMVSSIGGDLDHKSCWELLTDETLASRYFSAAERHLFHRHILWTRLVAARSTTLPRGYGDLPEYIRAHREELVLKPNRGYGGTGVTLGAATTAADWDRLIDTALRDQDDPRRCWVVQAVTTLPVHLFPVIDAAGRVHSEPFYAVMGFAPTDHGLGIICRVSQKQVVNVAQRGGLAPVLLGHKPETLRTWTRAQLPPERAAPELRERIARLRRLEAITRVLEWDEETYRPSAAAGNRAEQLALLESLRHDLLADDRLGDLIEQTAEQAAGDARTLAELKRLRRLRRTALALPHRLVVAFAEARSRCLAAWEEARDREDYRIFAAAFEPLLTLLRERAASLQTGPDRYDALLDEHEPGMTRERLDPLLRAIGARLLERVPLLADATARHARRLPMAEYADREQQSFCRQLLTDMGFDFTRGRVDRSTHPFTLVAGDHDVRVTIRVVERDPLRAILATLHEGGHALYDQGFPADFAGTLLADAPSTGLHESQARLWENHIGRSKAFWTHYFGRLRAAFPGPLAGLDATAFHRAINVVAPGANRISADPVTYDLHILLRYELEVALLAGDVLVGDLPAAWDERSAHYLGVKPASPRDGCLQDVHWSLGEFGYFPTYTIGNLFAAQLIEVYRGAAPLDSDLEQGRLEPLRRWLGERIHAHGALLDAEDLIERATGRRLDADAFFRSLERRAAELTD